MMHTIAQTRRAMESAALSRTGGTVRSAKTRAEGGFQAMLDQARAEKTETSAQELQQLQREKVIITRHFDAETGEKKIHVTPEQAAMLAAGYSQMHIGENGMVLTVTLLDENGIPQLPLATLEWLNGTRSNSRLDEYLIDDYNEWVMEPTPELIAALERLQRKTGDLWSVESVVRRLMEKLEDTTAERKAELVIGSSGAIF